MDNNMPKCPDCGETMVCQLKNMNKDRSGADYIDCKCVSPHCKPKPPVIKINKNGETQWIFKPKHETEWKNETKHETEWKNEEKH